MTRISNLLDKNKLSLYVLIIVIVFLIFSVAHTEPQVSIRPVKENALTETEKLIKENYSLRERLIKLEPVSPVKIVTVDPPSKSIDTLPVLTVMSEGTRVPFDMVCEDPSWVRPDYEPYWHSKQGRWSRVPDRIQSSYHRLFVTLGTENLWNETIHDSGTVEIAGKIDLPVYDGKTDSTVAVVAIRHRITDIIILNNQVILLGAPSRTGIQILTINKQDLIRSSGELIGQKNNQEYLFQLVTPDGYEIDYNNVVVSF